MFLYDVFSLQFSIAFPVSAKSRTFSYPVEGFDFDYLVFEQGLKILNAKVEAWIKDAAKKAGKAVRLPLFAGAGLVATAWESSGGALPCCFWHELTGTKSINRTYVLVVFSWCAIGLGRYVRNCIFQFHLKSVYLAIIQGDPMSTQCLPSSQRITTAMI